jgi:hypothetical protein
LCTPNACKDRLGAAQVSVGDRRADTAHGRRQLVQDGDDRLPDGRDRIRGQQRDDQDADRTSDKSIKTPFQAATSTRGSRVATSTAELPACVAINGPLSSQTAIVIARATTSAICQAPLPMTAINRSPIPTPTLTPTTSSTARRIRRAPFRLTTAAIGAKNGRWWPISSVATHQAIPAATAHCAIGRRA